MDSTSITSTISSGKSAVLRMESLLKSCSKPEVKAGKMALLKCGSTASKVASAKKSGAIMSTCNTRLTAGYARSAASPGAQPASARRRARRRGRCSDSITGPLLAPTRCVSGRGVSVS